MATPQYRDEVLVTLTSIDPPSSFAFPDRRFFLTKEKPRMGIGRTSRRNAALEAAKTNAWFDSAVMSRDHAQLKLDVDKQKVYIEDVGSLHGTYKNGKRLPSHSSSLISPGDLVRFGITIERGSDKFPPCVMEARLKFGTIDPEDRPKVFRVPDDSDVEESNSDGEDYSIRNSSQILRKVNIRPAALGSSPSTYSPRYSPIDLTAADQYPVSNVREELERASLNLRHTLDALETVADLPSSSPTKPAVVTDYPDPSPVWLLGSEDQDMEVHLSDSTDMDTDSSAELSSSNVSVADEVRPTSSILSAKLDESESDDDEFEGNEVFEDYVPEDFVDPQIPNGKNSLDCQDTDDHSADDEDQASSDSDVSDDQNSSQEDATATVQEIGDQNVDNTIGGMGYMLNHPAPLPGYEPMLSWFGGPHQGHVRLPSISEAVHAPSRLPLSQPNPLPLSQSLGAKTGKTEYFAAREENRYKVLNASQPCRQPVAFTIPAPHVTPGSLPHCECESSINSVDAEKSEKTETLGESGVKFINSPPMGNTQTVPAEDIPDLNETSAFQFEMSKKVAAAAREGAPITPAATAAVSLGESSASAVKRTRIGIDEMLQDSTEATVEPVPTGVSVKRKADEMLQDPAEDIVDSSIHENCKVDGDSAQPSGERGFEDMMRLQFPVNSRMAATGAEEGRTMEQEADATVAGASNESSNEPPRKRLRHVAEAVGYVALGGVAVMTALIATAPTL